MFIIDIMMAISNWLWGWPLLILTSAVAVYLSVRFKFFQFTRFGHAMKNTFGKIFDKGDGEGDISPFQACCTALASTLGVGNIAGVSVAIATGGPGAVFWMWAVALMGFIVKFSEITLGMAYRERDPETGRWHGGFYWYVRRGLGKGVAVGFMCDNLHITPAQCMAFGDYLNDVELLRSVGESYAMANAHERLKKVAKHVCPSNDEDGVCRTIRSVLAVE